MARFLVHGLVVETASALPFDPGADLLAGFPVAAAGAAAGLHLSVGPGAVTPLSPGAPAEVILLQPQVRAVLAGGEIRIEAPGFLARVPPGGRTVEAVVDAVGRAAPGRHALTHVHLFLALAAALRLRGWIHLHAACTVARDGAPLLLAGPGGSGKSTLCAALVSAGHRYLGDDVLFLEGATGRLLAFPRPFHLGPAAAGAIPGAAPHLGEGYGPGDKRALDDGAAFPGRAVASAGPPRILLFPTVAAGRAETLLEPLMPVEAAALLLESSAYLAARLPGHREQLAALAGLADGARAFRATLGRDLLDDAVAAARRVTASAGVGSP